jgi:hypothetical protein
MHHVRQENLPFVGSSYEFVGAEQGDTDVSVFLFHGKPGPGGKPGSGPGPHRHRYGRGKPLPYDVERRRSGARMGRRLPAARSLRDWRPRISSAPVTRPSR